MTVYFSMPISNSVSSHSCGCALWVNILLNLTYCILYSFEVIFILYFLQVCVWGGPRAKLWKLAVGKKEYFSGGFIQYFPCIRGDILICTGLYISIGPQREGSDHGVNIEEGDNGYVVFQWNFLGSVAKFIVSSKFIGPDWREKVDSVIGLSFQPVRLLRMAGWYDNLML